MKFRQLAAPLLFACLSPMAIAETQGTLGSNSTGDTDVTITIGDLVQVQNFDNIPFGTWDGVGNESNTDSFCIYRNSDNDVDVTFTSLNGAGTAFTMSDGGTETLNYTVDLSSLGTNDNTVGLQSGTTYGLVDEDNTDTDCSGAGDSHTLTVNLLATDLSAATAGSYSDTITVVVTPQ